MAKAKLRLRWITNAQKNILNFIRRVISTYRCCLRKKGKFVKYLNHLVSKTFVFSVFLCEQQNYAFTTFYLVTKVVYS